VGRPPSRGDRVGLLGAEIGVDDLAARAGTIGYEVLTSLGRRYRRIYTAGTEHLDM
jgi:alanine racemase